MTIHIVAHRGDCQHHDENTLACIQSALTHGIHAIEIDVQLTRDGVPVLFHDRKLSAFLNNERNIGEYDYLHIKHLLEEQKNLALAALSHVVDLIKQHPKSTLFVEVKRVNFLHFSYQEVYQRIIDMLNPIISQVVLISFSYRFLLFAKKRETKHNPVTLGYVLPNWHALSAKMLTKLTPRYIFCDTEIIPEKENLIAHSQSNQPFNWVLYEISSLKQANHFIKQGITGLETFTPVLLKQQLTQQRLPQQQEKFPKLASSAKPCDE